MIAKIESFFIGVYFVIGVCLLASCPAIILLAPIYIYVEYNVTEYILFSTTVSLPMSWVFYKYFVPKTTIKKFIEITKEDFLKK